MIRNLVWTGCLLAAAVSAQSTVTISVDPKAPGSAIPSDFLGLSFETSNLLPNANGGYLFSPENKPLLALFKTLGIRSLRVGGGMADRTNVPIPEPKDIDQFFAFAAAAEVNVLYTLRLPRASVQKNAEIAKYIQERYASQLTCFEIGNEPDFYRRVYREIPDYATYRGLWLTMAEAVKKAAPGAKFCGPASGGTTAWSRNFAQDFGRTGMIAAVVQHDYPGGEGSLLADAPARDAMLSRAWMEHYDQLYQSFGLTAVANGLPFRLEETNNFTGGSKNASDTFAASLWALDYLHWWAAHGASGMNFHNRRWILNTTIYPVDTKDDGLKSGYLLHPIGYGLKAFALGGHGEVKSLAITSNPDAVNVTAYAVRDGANLFVTVINKKDPGSSARGLDVTILAPRVGSHAESMLLTAADFAKKDGITLGGAPITNGAWQGKWMPVESAQSGKVVVKVPAVSAAVVKLSLE